MTSKEFVYWMKGFAIAKITSYPDLMDDVLEAIDEVSDLVEPSPADERDNWNIYAKVKQSKDILHD